MDMPQDTGTLVPLEEALATQQSALESALEELAQKAGEAQAAIGAFHATIDDHKARVLSLHNETSAVLEKVKAEGGGSEAVQRELREQLTKLENDLEDAWRQAENSAKRIAEWEAEAKAKAAAAEAAEAIAEDLKAALEDRDKESNALQHQLEEARVALEAREQDTGLKDRLEALEAAEASLKAECDTLRNALEEKDAALTELEAVAARITDEQSSREAALADLEKECNALRADAEAGEAAAREAAELRDTLAERERDLEALKTRIEEATTEAAAWKMKCEAAASEEELDALRQRLEEEQERAAALEEQLESERSKGTKSALAQQLTEALKEAETAQAELRQLRKELGGARPGTSGKSAPKVAPVQEPDEEEARIIAAAKGGNGKRSIGEILEVAGIVNRAQIDEAMEEQRSNPMKHLGGIFVEKGYAKPEAVAQALACQCDVRFVRLGENTVQPEAASLIHARLAQQHTCIPISASGNSLKLALVNPMDLLAIEDVERSSGKEVEVVVATAADIQSAIEKFYWEPE